MSVPAGPAGTKTTLVDAHVHLHDCFDAAAFLDRAAANFTAAARALGLEATPLGCLMLTESRGVDHFASLALGTASSAAWQVSATDEPVSLIASKDNAAPIVLIAGRQIVCREGLEVLGLGTRATFADGLPMRETLQQVVAEQALAVLPWGVGKWHGARGRLVAELIAERPVPFAVGDNGGRLARAPEPKLFAAARNAGIRVLPGSDPLPFAAQIGKVAGYGLVADVALDQARPFAALKDYIGGQDNALRGFGRLETMTGFIRSQVAMQIQKRRRPRPS